MEDVGPEDGSPGADQFKREVAETFLRCIKEHISHDNAVIELNGLKIAEDRTFADCARCRGRRAGAWAMGNSKMGPVHNVAPQQSI